MHLYRLEAELPDRTVTLVLVAESDRAAFEHAEVLLAKHFVAMPDVRNLALLEKKRPEGGAGYVIDTV